MSRPPAARPSRRPVRRVALAALALLPAALAACGDATPTGLAVATHAPVVARAAAPFPEIIALPNGILPEGIATGRGTTFYAGSRADGSIYRGDLRTGEGAYFAAGPGTPAVGLEYDARRDRVWVAGGGAGNVLVYDGDSGARLAEYPLAVGATFINDLVVTRDAVYATDSRDDVLYRIPLGPGGALPAPDAVGTLPLGDGYDFVPGVTNANGIEASPDGRTLLVVNSATATLYRVDAATGATVAVDLGGAPLTNGDGLLFVGRTLYVVQNRLDRIAVLSLAPDLASGTIERTITSPAFDVPTTVAAFGGSLYAVNARFTTPPTPTTPYSVVRVDR